ncbi:periplasmic heavy metal sensor [Accumulibacter sp.]|uniref:periplasmic heavy metal sensor n=1 Tax=Accumulibacter sp. TaxID=2053492 RepID=UPI002C1FA9A7|nr:periplasmic heavy metal sensor [Accumulibacter sp.]HNC21087.1 periplasmic heavy metal sensor [Accumulibacter sp.]
MKSKFSPRILVTALVLALGVGGAAFAMSPERCGPPGGRMEQRMQYHQKEMSRLHDDLKLDAKQEAPWQDAEQFSKSGMREMREQMRKHHEEILASVSKPGADLRAIIKQMDELRDAARKQREAGRDRWLAVYDTLDAAQKEKARLFFKSKIERMGPGGHFGPGGPRPPRGPAGD